MLRTIEVASADDPRLADYTTLTDAALRTHLETEHGLFIAEGIKVITRAVAAGYPVRSMLLTRSRLIDLPALGEANDSPGESPENDTPVYVVPDEVAERLTGYRVHRGALASLARRPLPEVAELIADARRIVVLEDLVDHANVGAIFRCAAALGVDAIVLSPRCADPLYRRSVKVSMGAVFAIPYARMTNWYDGLADLKATGFRVLALTPDESATPIDIALNHDKSGMGTGGGMDNVRGRGDAGRAEGGDGADDGEGAGSTGDGGGVRGAGRGGSGDGGRVALVFGTEGDGLSARWLREADEAVRIPMSRAARAAGVDSLNVVAAAAIACNLLTAE